MRYKNPILNLAYDLAYDLELSIYKKYTEPSIYDANGDMKKRWYVYYSYRCPETDKLIRQTPIYANVNTFKKKKERKRAVENLRKAISLLLKNGFNPYAANHNQPLGIQKEELIDKSIDEAFDFVLQIKEKSLKESSFRDFKSRILQFKKWLYINGFRGRKIKNINKKVVNEYLNQVLLKSSAANRNNTRNNLSVFFGFLHENDWVDSNFVLQIKRINAKPERNKTYTNKQQVDIFDFIKDNNPVLSLFIKFISYNFLRPIEVARLKVEDIDVFERRVYVRAKNKAVKIKIIPEILITEIPDLTQFESQNFLFTPFGFGKPWNVNEVDKRNWFSKDFKKVKDKFGLGKDYGLYSFRHTFITRLYNDFAQSCTPFEAKSKLMLITGHTTMSALEKYLRDIDAVLPDDYSKSFD